MKQLHLIYFVLLPLYEAHSVVDISKMHTKFMVKWTISEKDFFNSNSGYLNGCEGKLLKTASVKFTGIKNLSFQLALLTKASRFEIFSKKFNVGILPEFPYLDVSKAINLEYAFVYTPRIVYKLKDEDGLLEPSNYIYTHENKDSRKAIFPNGTTTIHCMISVKSEVKTKLTSISHARCNSYVLKNNYTSDKIRCYNTGIKGDYIDDYVYSGQIPILSIAKAMAIIDVHSQRIQKLRAPELLDRSLDYLKKHMTSENVIDILNLAYRKNITSLRDSCLNYLKYKCTIRDLEIY